MSPDLKKKFDAAAKEVLNAKKDPGNDLKLRLYAHYKQATEGDNTAKKPSFSDIVARAKWDAWTAQKGLSADEAKQKYIDLIESLRG